jgi:hypothetical protein
VPVPPPLIPELGRGFPELLPLPAPALAPLAPDPLFVPELVLLLHARRKGIALNKTVIMERGSVLFLIARSYHVPSR